MFTPTALDQTLPEALQPRLNQAPDDWGSKQVGNSAQISMGGCFLKVWMEGGKNSWHFLHSVTLYKRGREGERVET